MPRGKTTKCPICGASMSACYVKIPRKKKGENIVYAGTSYYCRTDGTFVVAGPAEQ